MYSVRRSSLAISISIHAPRVGRDVVSTIVLVVPWDFNPRAPCGARPSRTVITPSETLFQSTRPVWGATINQGGFQNVHFYFNPRAPCGARQGWVGQWDIQKQFQSTRPVWGATFLPRGAAVGHDISIHAPRVGRDSAGQPCGGPAQDFNPRAPCGARRGHAFLVFAHQRISIHAPRVGRDVWRPLRPSSATYFNPRAPCGARHLVAQQLRAHAVISIHAPRVGRDGTFVEILDICLISIHAPRVGRDSKFDDFTPSNLHKRYKRVLARPKNTREKGKIKQKLAYIHAFSAFLGCEGSGTFCALVLRTQYR